MLSFSAITVRLGGRLILDQATASLPPGSHVGLIGRNGAGKSTLMKVVAGLLESDGGTLSMPRETRIGYIAQEAPEGTATPYETVLAADKERATLMAASETEADLEKLAEIHERLNAIDAYTAPARASRILAGLGFDETMQAQPLSSFSGGWRMRVALGALLFSAPDLLLLDEPSNHLDLEAVLWLENFLRSYRGTLLLISHERDFLNKVADHILHLQQGKLTLYPGGYDAFERQRAERLSQVEAARNRQLAEREKLQSFVNRWRTKAHSARQAQSRMKALEKMEPIAAAVEDPSLSFSFPSPDANLKPPLITLDQASVGYGEKPILSHLNLRIDPDDRLAFIGRNGNGKTTLAKLLVGQLSTLEGAMTTSSKIKVGYFTQYQVEELDVEDSPLDHMTRLMPGSPTAAVRAQLGRFGFSGEKATQKVGSMSGGERARLALALITRDAPHLLILDEPTNHLDVDVRQALIEALAEYRGAVIIVSHDRHMLELTADRLILVDNGNASDFEGDLDDYTDFILGRNDRITSGQNTPKPQDRKAEKKARAEARQKNKILRDEIKKLELKISQLTARRNEIDQALFDPKSASSKDKSLTVTELMKLRSDVEEELNQKEALWLEKSETLE
ncbi:MAG: ABC-F family ATP-binding cassette domain-containing protein [Zymomonas mobilis subsp. pomaceae]|uniref:ABC transporter related protein n=1 Tax=Zymomonas mobilis subsp. pomaceae (strain ATCC 29192 / DSM 22645 / JCM 10191 / CCUG 17912 / NBRC 13757 / NCIMB 11200 / NRRL B-4491 / Barker I) TaxID=579138 RepID=F8ESU1_ZYMMT|nr:ABC-F family ATP-binding cassette domain-containing protein [Zymomonas mobilis]AEI36907.1 ABC transporter related protein [Zymomonas mobilis subsp. pomaceae ATCC 29192]MDX5948280.1 ABC-F family ATP-binding cassette domain-containing protein [Zymomonas mobilis subsp. pomaceae]GEB89034.1 glycosyl transferase family 1 [Zymomonas mobilis subsp. pomaceae]